MWGRGDVSKARVMVIGEYPDSSDNGTALAFTRNNLIDIIIEAGMDPNEFYFTYMVKCQTPVKKGRSHRDTTKAQQELCRKYLEQEAQEIQPEVTILLGAKVLASFKLDRSVNQMRGEFIDVPGFGAVTATYSNKALYVNPDYSAIIRRDFITVRKKLFGERIEVCEIGKGVEIAHDRETIHNHLERAANAPFVASDLEGTGLAYWEKDFQVTHYGASYGPGMGVVFDPRLFPDEYAHFLTLPQVVHNATYEGGIYPKSTPIIADTQILSHLNNPFLPCGLEDRTNIHIGNASWKGHETDWDSWARRNAIDVDATRQLYLTLWESLTDKQRSLHNNIILPSAIIYAGIQTRGIGLDVQHMYNTEADLTATMNKIHWEAVQKFGWPKDGNLGSSDQVADFMYDTLKIQPPKRAYRELSKHPSTEADILAELALEHDFPALVRRYRKAQKLLSNYIYKDDSGYYLQSIHPKFNITGTVTGRPSSYDPPGQTFAKEDYIRKIYIARRGLIVSGDLTQVELVLLGARYAQDPTMVRIYTTGGDVHQETGMAMAALANEEYNSGYRSKAKPCNFLLIYGGSAQMLRLTALKNYGVRFSADEAKAYRTAWFNKYYGIKMWHDKGATRCLMDGYVESWTGRRWDLAKAMSSNYGDQAEAIRCWYNYQTQEVGAVLNLIGLLEAHKLDNDAPFLTVHDEVDNDVPAEDASDFAYEWRRNWEKKMDEFYPHKVPITVGVEIGPSLGELKEVA